MPKFGSKIDVAGKVFDLKRQNVATKNDMLALVVPRGYRTFCDELDAWYEYMGDDYDVDETTGRWRKVNSGLSIYVTPQLPTEKVSRIKLISSGAEIPYKEILNEYPQSYEIVDINNPSEDFATDSQNPEFNRNIYVILGDTTADIAFKGSNDKYYVIMQSVEIVDSYNFDDGIYLVMPDENAILIKENALYFVPRMINGTYIVKYDGKWRTITSNVIVTSNLLNRTIVDTTVDLTNYFDNEGTGSLTILIHINKDTNTYNTYLINPTNFNQIILLEDIELLKREDDSNLRGSIYYVDGNSFSDFDDSKEYLFIENFVEEDIYDEYICIDGKFEHIGPFDDAKNSTFDYTQGYSDIKYLRDINTTKFSDTVQYEGTMYEVKFKAVIDTSSTYFERSAEDLDDVMKSLLYRSIPGGSCKYVTRCSSIQDIDDNEVDSMTSDYLKVYILIFDANGNHVATYDTGQVLGVSHNNDQTVAYLKFGYPDNIRWDKYFDKTTEFVEYGYCDLHIYRENYDITKVSHNDPSVALKQAIHYIYDDYIYKNHPLTQNKITDDILLTSFKLKVTNDVDCGIRSSEDSRSSENKNFITFEPYGIEDCDAIIVDNMLHLLKSEAQQVSFQKPEIHDDDGEYAASTWNYVGSAEPFTGVSDGIDYTVIWKIDDVQGEFKGVLWRKTEIGTSILDYGKYIGDTINVKTCKIYDNVAGKLIKKLLNIN